MPTIQSRGPDEVNSAVGNYEEVIVYDKDRAPCKMRTWPIKSHPFVVLLESMFEVYDSIPMELFADMMQKANLSHEVAKAFLRHKSFRSRFCTDEKGHILPI